MTTRKQPRHLGLRLAAVALCAPLAAAAQDGPQPKLPTTELTAGMHVIHAELALYQE